MTTTSRSLLLGCWTLLIAAQALGGSVPVPRNLPYPGTITLAVDVRDVEQRLIRVSEVIPVTAGRLTLLYPQWLPGNHAPRGAIDELAGLVIEANGRRLAWQRDPTDVYAFHVDVPLGAEAVSVAFQVATPTSPEGGRVVFTPSVLNLQWNQAILYPAGYYASGIAVDATVTLPTGWRQASALPVIAAGDTVHFAPVTLETLVDSPLFAGLYTGMLDLAPGAKVPVHLDIFAETQADLAPTAEQVVMHRALVREAYAALGEPHYDHYDFLLAIGEQLGGIGLEHHRSSENSQGSGYFRAWDEAIGERDRLAHEFTHAWNGKRRRPADLWTPNFNVPMQNSLLWVYEGMTEYYGWVLTARAGLWSSEFAREAFAAYAAIYQAKRPGRDWRALQDTTSQPVMTARRPLSWVSWQRTEDYYGESAILWLGVDARIRELTRGSKGLDDMARSFLGAPAQQGPVSTYRQQDVVKALNDVAPYDWKAYLEERVTAVPAPLDGLEHAGLKLAFDETPNAVIRDSERARKHADLSYSLGLVISKDALLTEVVWDGPAFKAGLAPGSTLLAVNGRSYNAELLRDAVTRAKSLGEPIELLVRSQDRYRTVRIDYHDGLRYPHLVPIEGTPDRLAEILKPRRPQT